MRRRAVVPGLVVLRHYDRRWTRADLLAGVTVAAYLVPQGLAYAGIAGLPAIAGLWGSLPALAAYALLGTSRLLSAGPESTTALMTAAVVAPLAAGDPGRHAALAATLAFTVGVLCLVSRALRLGALADLLSRPTLVGYLAGLAVIMVASQLSRLTGVATHGATFLAQLASFGAGLATLSVPTTLFAAAVLAFLFGLRRMLPGAPGPLLAVLLATVVVAVFDLDAHGIAVVGAIPAGLPAPALPDLTLLPGLLAPAAGVLLVSFSDTILTARSFPGPGPDGRIDANQELIALGVANLGAGVFRGLPVSASGSRTALAASAGARTQLHSLVALVVVAATAGFLGPLLRLFPSAALGAIVVYAAAGLVDLAGFRRLARFRSSELLLALAALAGVLIFGILYGVLLAVALSVADMLARVARPHDAVLGLVPGLAGMHDVRDYPRAHTVPGLLVYRYDSPLFFANAEDFRRRALAAVDGQREPVAWFVLNMEANIEVDITALEAVERVRAELRARGVVFALARVKQEILAELRAYGLAGAIGDELIFPTLPTAVEAYRRRRAAPDR